MSLFSSKRRLILIVVGIIILLIIVIASILLSSQQPDITPSPSPAPSSSPLPSLNPLLSSLTITDISPTPNSALQLGGTRISIAIEFDQPINPQTVTVTSSPNLNLKPTTLPPTPNQLILKVQTPWQFNQTYTVSVDAGARSLDNRFELKDSINLRYVTESTTPSLVPAPGPDT